MLVTMADDVKTPSTVADEAIKVNEVSSFQNLSATRTMVSKKTILIVVVCLGVTVIVTGAIVGGMYMFAQTTKDIVKYTLTYKDSSNADVKEDITSDRSDNSVQYHVVESGKEIWIVNDFNTNIQVTRVQAESGVMCYVNALNRTLAQDPSTITEKPAGKNDKTDSKQLVYKMSDSSISDISFMSAKAAKLCKNIPSYWVLPDCSQIQPGLPTNSSADSQSPRQKRAVYCGSYYGYNCYCGCNYAVCGCVTGWFNYHVGNINYCNFYYQPSCPVWMFRSAYSGL